ncbi:hypothetical protein [Paraflavitalea soli]|nr:hypothetical protein [Paraflavitalea soli]
MKQIIRFIVKHRVYFIWLSLVAVLATLKGCFLKNALLDTAPAPASKPSPLVEAAPDSAILLLSLTKEEAILCRGIHKGSQVILCRTDSTTGATPADCYGPIRVAAAHSNSTETPGDLLFLQVPITEVWKINACLAATKRSILLLPPKSR